MKVFQLSEDTYATADYNERTGVLHIRTHEYVLPVIEANRQSKKDPSNGFTQSREGALGRLIGRPSSTRYRQWQMEFERMGGKMQSNWVPDWQKFLRKKLKEDHDSRTVARLVNPGANDKHIIIK